MNQFQIRQYKFRGTQRQIFVKKSWKQQQSVNKAFWSHFKHFGRLLGKIYLFLTPSKTDGRAPMQPARCTYNLQPDLVESFPVDVCPDITGQCGLGHRAKDKIQNPALQWGDEGEGGGGLVEDKQVPHKGHIAAILDIKFLFPSITFLLTTYYFFQISQPVKICLKNRYFEKQIHWVPWKLF